MIKSRLVLIPFVLLLLAFPAYSQDEKIMGQYSIKTGKGYLFGNNSDDKSFTLEINAENLKVERNNQNPSFSMKDRVLQVLIVGVEGFVPFGKKLNVEETLRQHMTWEADYLSGEYGSKLKPEAELIESASRKTLFWWFKRPKYNEEFDREFLITTLVGNELLGISVSVTPATKHDEIRKFLTDIMDSLKIYDKPVDVMKLAEKYKN